METTIEVIDIALYDRVKNPKEYIPNFLRVMASTAFSLSAVNISYCNNLFK